jgi:hypothetical protein
MVGWVLGSVFCVLASPTKSHRQSSTFDESWDIMMVRTSPSWV